MSFADLWWPATLWTLSIVLGAAAALHAALTKDDVRAAIGWAGIAVLSPILGPILYALAGINRIRRTAVRRRRRAADGAAAARPDLRDERIAEAGGTQFRSLRRLGDDVSRFPLADGNDIAMLDGGDAALGAMQAAIAAAEKSVGLETYIFDNDRAGLALAESLIAAARRGVAVRVLIDAVGARYSRPAITRHLRRNGVEVGLFLHSFLGLRAPYANLRTHRKILVVDGRVAFTGGMNIREGFVADIAGDGAARDVHFRVEGPIVGQLFAVFAADWRFVSGESLGGEDWGPHPRAEGGAVLARAVESGPDHTIESTHDLIMGALAVAQERVRIATPYFLPDRQLVGALTIAARRGVACDIVIPAANNLRLVDWGMTAQLDQVIRHGCRVWRAPGPFDHAKLMVVDGAWALVGSSNLDPRSLRLNFELDVEVVDRAFAAGVEARIEQAIAAAAPETLATLAARPLAARLRNRLVWLASPYL